jgi:hypothetical protein
MKIAMFVFAFYLLALSLLPCSDVHDAGNVAQTQAVLLQPHEHETDQKDLCSPFCACNCCSTTIAVHFDAPKVTVNKIFITESPKTVFQNFCFCAGFYGNIWQPPKTAVTC